MKENSAKRTDQSGQQAAEPNTPQSNPATASPAPVGLLILAAILLVFALLAGTLLLSRPSDASSAPGQPKVVTVTANAPSSKIYPSYTPTGPRYSAQPISMPTSPKDAQVPAPVEPPAFQSASSEEPQERQIVTQDPREPAEQAERAPQTQAPPPPEPKPEQTVVIVQTLG